MLKQIDAADQVLAVVFSGTIEEEDVERFGDLLDRALEREGPIHFYAGVTGFTGIGRGAIEKAFEIDKAYLMNLKRFGRVAVVADKTWIRAASRLESMALPYVRYEMFAPEEREHALAWVKGEVDRPRPRSLRMLPTDEPGLIAFEIEGKLCWSDVVPLVEAVESAPAGQRLRLLGRIKSYDGFDWRLLAGADYLRLKLHLLKSVDRYALVGGPAWLATWMGMLDPLFWMEIRHFDLAEEDKAWRWLRSKEDEAPLRVEQIAV